MYKLYTTPCYGNMAMHIHTKLAMDSLYLAPQLLQEKQHSAACTNGWHTRAPWCVVLRVLCSNSVSSKPSINH